MTPTINGLWSRKDARRPGVVRVTDISRGYVFWTALDDSSKTGKVPVGNWERRYRPFTTPSSGTPTAPADEQEK